MSQLEHIEAIEKRLWSAADNLRDSEDRARATIKADYENLRGVLPKGEFFTPISLVSLIAHVIDPERGTVLDPACGSGGMFVQSARIVEEHGHSPTEKLTFRGLEKLAVPDVKILTHFPHHSEVMHGQNDQLNGEVLF